MAARNRSSEINLTRVYDAPLSAVWEAWTVPEEIAQWWGPRGFTLTTHSRDLRTGGHWHYTMHGPDGTDYENTTQYLEVVPRQRLVYDHGGHRDRPPLFRMTVLFTERDGRTRLDLSMGLATPEVAEQTRAFIRKAGGEAAWDRLAEHLGKRSGKEQFFIARSFDAGIDRLYDMWTDPAQLSQWLPPTGATMQFIHAEPRTGGTSFYAMQLPGGETVHGKLKFQQLERPRLVVYTQQFCDGEGNAIRPPFFPDWPLTMHTFVELAEEGPVRTRVTVRWEPGAEATAADIAEFARQKGSMTGGWTGSFDKLEAIVAD
ncbi:MAG TPA: SRPBCC family protein [Steroidobacteraceae bacterium]|nr:SRPBCC family protein [Steroidobacteraceae bacterium]